MRILVAAREELQAAVAADLEPQGHELIAASDGNQAMALFRRQSPDLVLTAFDPSNIHGLDLARLVRLGSRTRFIPVLMFARNLQPLENRQCMEAGVIAFMAEDFPPGELACRVDSIARFVKLQYHLLESQARHREELALVKHMLTRISGTESTRGAPGFHMETLQTQRINGDAFVYREAIPGVHFGMICDATGHGLMAGISTIPVLDTFLGMVARDTPLKAIYLEIHAKLKKLLPTGRFACLLLMRVDVAQGVLSVLNAGMPEVYLLRTSGAIQTFESRVLPAGIGGADPGIVVAEADITTGDRIFAFSDGLGDLLSAQDVSSRYLRDPSVLSHGEHCQVIRHLVDAAVLKAPNGDDITWALWEVPGQADPMRPGETGLVLTGKLMAGLEASFRLDPRVHAPRDLLPSVLSLLLAFQVSHAQTQLFGMLLAEALTNAVEHGLLNLDSSIKAQGFEAYEQHRLLALAGLESGGVRFTITLFHEEGSAGHAIRLLQAEVEDSGPGFKWSDWIPIRSDDGHRPFGRGIALLSALAKDLEYNEAGNRLRFSLECP